MVAPTCPVCTSRKWRKAAGTGELICSEGHVLQGYRNETIEITEMGAHTVHHRQLRTGRRRRGQREENLDVYYGPRARYLYYQCRQLVLRHQIDKLISEWGLPEEAKNICRTIWLLSLEVLPGKPSPQPWIHAQAEPESTDLNTQGGEERIDEPTKTKQEDPDQSSNSESSDDEAGGADARIDREIEKLMYEASDTESDPGSKERDAAKTERVNNRNARHCLYDSAATNIAILVLTCWWLRVPATYLDYINLINAYRIPYLDVMPLLSENMRRHLSVALRQELSPPHAPTVAALHVITRRIARRLQGTHGINIPEFNAAPVLWRAVRAFQGPPILYTMGKQLMERLEVPLTIYPSLAPKPSSGKSGFGGDWAPVEVTMAAVLVLVLKLVYGFQKDVKITWEDDDPASYFRDFPSYTTALRSGKESKRMEFDSLLSKTNDRTADTLRNEEIDKYLDVAERALGARAMGHVKSMRKSQSFLHHGIAKMKAAFRQLTTIYGDIQNSDRYAENVGSPRKNEVPLEALERPDLSQSMEHKVTKQPGETVVNWSSNDPFGVLPPDYELLIETASIWSGVEQSTVGRLVTLFERRLYRYSPKRREEVFDSDMDNEYIDIDQLSQRSGSQEELSKYNIKHEEDEINEAKVSENGYKLGSKNWRQRVHNKLSANNRSKSAYKQISSEEEGEELESEDSNSKPHSRVQS
ncbi:hypothetical protein FRC12_009829 [Ceratobasidium sp. 428]|nr:hypothetical protein FRC12_009829 [Ceratobasidium sp. 428]